MKIKVKSLTVLVTLTTNLHTGNAAPGAVIKAKHAGIVAFPKKIIANGKKQKLLDAPAIHEITKTYNFTSTC